MANTQSNRLIRFTNEQLDASTTTAYAMLLELYLHHHMPGAHMAGRGQTRSEAPVAPNGQEVNGTYH
jgi:hypothetical protein